MPTLSQKQLESRIAKLESYRKYKDVGHVISVSMARYCISDLIQIAKGTTHQDGGGIFSSIFRRDTPKKLLQLHQDYEEVKSDLGVDDLTFRQVKRYFDTLGKYNELQNKLERNEISSSMDAIEYIKKTLLPDKNMLLFPFIIEYEKHKISLRMMELIDSAIIAFMHSYISFSLMPDQDLPIIITDMRQLRLDPMSTIFDLRIRGPHDAYAFARQMQLLISYMDSHRPGKIHRQKSCKIQELWQLYQLQGFDEQLACSSMKVSSSLLTQHHDNMLYLLSNEDAFPSDFPMILLDFAPKWVFARDESVYPTSIEKAFCVYTRFDKKTPVYVYWDRKNKFVSFVLVYCFDTGIHHVGSHVTDVEFVRAYYDDALQPTKWFLSCHTNKDGHWIEINDVKSDRLVVWVARGTHAHYPKPGTWVRIVGLANDVCSNGQEWKPNKFKFLERKDEFLNVFGGGRGQFANPNVVGNLRGAIGRIFMPHAIDKFVKKTVKALTPKRRTKQHSQP